MSSRLHGKAADMQAHAYHLTLQGISHRPCHTVFLARSKDIACIANELLP